MGSFLFNKISKTTGVFTIALICILGLISEMILSYFFMPINKEVVVIITNLLINTVTAVVSYYMGASRPDDNGSQVKTITIPPKT